jgi:hypothetical protein
VPGIASIRFDPITRAAWDEGRRNDVARNRALLQDALERKAARARFVATSHGSVSAQPLDEAHNRRTVRRQRVERGCPMPGQQHRRHRRRGVLIESNDGSRLHHDRPPLYAALR